MFSRTTTRGAAARMIRRLLGAAGAAALCLGAALPLRAQQPAPGGSVEGTVTDEATQAPLSGAIVQLRGTGLGVLTDAAGRFRITGVAPGTYVVSAQRIGSREASERVEVGAGAAARVELRLATEAVALPTVVVTATREVQRLGQTAATIGVVGGAELARTKPTHPAEVLGQIPGVWVSVTGGEGHMTSIRLPQTTNPMYLFLEDGVPTRSTGFYNHNALYEVNVPQAERIEVLKGPATALYGSDAIGGVINVETRAPSLTPSAEAYLEGGAFGWRRFLGSVGDTRGGDGVRADVNVTHSDGWRSATGYDRQSGTVRWDRRLGATSSLRTVAAVSHVDQQTAGASSLLRADFLRDPEANYTPISFRRVLAVRLSSAFEHRTERSLLSLTPYARYDDMDILPNWSLTYDPTTYDTRNASVGVLAKYRRELPGLGARVIAGVDVDHSPGRKVERAIQATRSGQVFSSYVAKDTLYDYDVTFQGISPYAQIDASPTDRLHLTAGLRYDHVGFDYATHLAPVQTGKYRRPADASPTYDHLSPKAGITYEAATALNLYALYGHGFRAPSEGQLFRQGQAVSTIDLKPVVADNVEGGARGQLFGRLGYQLAVYRMDVKDDVLSYINADGTRETVNAGETLHRGVEVGIGSELFAGLRADVAYSRSKHTYESWSPKPGVDYGGHEVEAAPRTKLNARLNWAPRQLDGARLGLEWVRIGSFWEDADNTHRYGGHDLLNLRVNAPLGRGLELVGRLDNVTDKRYAETAAFTVARGEELAPGMPRSVFLGLQYRWNR
ncbi:MAG TPA: TonB-dependent receptor [Longimicrobiales bacterium]|nr:TonB-dependent receptor [Longimicrobiales bacterium]